MNKNESNKSIGRNPDRLGSLSDKITVYGFPITVIGFFISIISLFHFEITVKTTLNTVHIVFLVVLPLLFFVFFLKRHRKIKKYVQAWKTFFKIQRSLLKEQNENNSNSIENYINDQLQICNSTSEILYKLTGRRVSVSIKLIGDEHGKMYTRSFIKSSPSSENLSITDYRGDVEFNYIIGELLSQGDRSGVEYDFVWVNNEVLNKYHISVTGNDCYKSTAVLPLLYNDNIYAFLCIDGLKAKDLNDFFTNHLLLSLSMILSYTGRRIYKLLLNNDKNNIDKYLNFRK